MRRFVVIITILVLVLTSVTVVTAQDDSNQPIVHVVQAGENLFRISLRYGVSMANIQAANSIVNTNLIFTGQQLVIPGTTGGTSAPPPADTTQPATPPSGEGAIYTVVAGDTLASIASRYGTTYLAIAAANGIANPNLISVGQQLTIPGATGTTVTIPPSNPGTTYVSGTFELGGHVESFSQPGQMHGAGMTWVKRQYNWTGQSASDVQGLIDQAHNNGFKILLGIVGDPNLGGNRQQYIQNYAQFVGEVARLGPDAIEVWNEPNLDRQWPAGQISGANYTEMLRAAYSTIKNANASVMVISAAPAPTGAEGAFPGRVVNDDNFIRGMAASGAASVMDCVGIHYNEGIVPPTARSGDPRDTDHYTRYYPTMVELYSSVFPGKPLCFTELGYLSPQGYGPLPPGFEWAANVTVQNQAEWLSSIIHQAKNSIRLIIIWNVDFTRYDSDPMAGYAIIRPDNTCPACVTLGAAMNQ